MPSTKSRSRSLKDRKDRKKVSPELVAKNETFQQDFERAQAQTAILRHKLRLVLGRLADCMDLRWKNMHQVTAPDFDVVQMSDDVIMKLLDHVAEKHKERETSVESRVEQLEKQVTQLAFDLLHVSKKCRAYENGLHKLLTCSDIYVVKDKIYELQIVAGEAFHSSSSNDPSVKVKEAFGVDGVTEREDGGSVRELKSTSKFQLTPEACRLPGDTLLRALNHDLKLYMIKELSIQKPSGADWETLAERVDVPLSLIEDIKTRKLVNPAGHVFSAWLEMCPSATVRQLHRHLISPQMRCTIMGKRLSDFYDVV